MDIETHIRVLGWLHIALNTLSLIVGVGLLLLVLLAAHLFSQWVQVPPIALYSFGFFIGLYLCATALPGLLLGYGLLTKACWSRLHGLVMSFLILPNFPLGTLAGIYGFTILSTSAAYEVLCKKNTT